MDPVVILIAGPTAVGKTELAIELAQHFRTEILSADSRQCYRELKIGVARPSEDELSTVPHHFIASHSVRDQLTAASYEQYAMSLSEKIFHDHDVLVVAGGTGLYIQAFLEGLDPVPSVPLSLRSMLNEQYRQQGIEWLRSEIMLKDVAYAASGDLSNPQRMLRALEVMEATGRSVISFQTGEIRKRPFQVIQIGLDLPRAELYQRINDRVTRMMDDGLLEEVSALLQHEGLPALQTVGYKELIGYIKGNHTLEKAIELIRQHTRQYAKRQLTWFRNRNSLNWFHPKDKLSILAFIHSILENRRMNEPE